VPVLIPVVVAVLMVAFCTRAALSQNALQSERFLGYFDDTANLRWGATPASLTTMPVAGGICPALRGGIFEATLYVESRQDEKQLAYAFQASPWPNAFEKLIERKGTTASTPGPFAEMRRDGPTRGFIEIGRVSITVPTGCQFLQTSASRVYMAAPVFNGADTVVTLGSAPLYAGGADRKPY
jgi:hypothetical protein